MFWLSKDVNFSTSTGHDSLNRTAWEISAAPNAAITKKVSNIVIAIANTLFILILTKKLTTGCSTMAIITAKTIGTMMLLARYKTANNAKKPIMKMVAFA